MKTIFDSFTSALNRSNNGLEFLNEEEMNSVRGGTEPPRPTSRPRDIFDEEEQ